MNEIEVALERIESARRRGEEECEVALIDHNAWKPWWFAFIFQLFGWIPLRMMAEKSRLTWEVLRDQGYRPYIKYVVADCFRETFLPVMVARIG